MRKKYKVVQINLLKHSVVYNDVQKMWHDGTFLYLVTNDVRHMIPIKDIESVRAKS